MTAVILDTDIGTDIDDTWALAMMLNCPELDIKMVATATGDPTYRAGIVAGVLNAAGRDDVPIAIGLPTRMHSQITPRPQAGYARAARLDNYRGTVADDGIRAIVDCVLNSPEPVTIVAIGPLTNIAAALELEPLITQNARFVGMHGAIRSDYSTTGTGGGPVPEYNVVHDVEACRAVFAADWEVTITPLDTCGKVVLDGDRYTKVRDSDRPLARAVMANYQEWFDQGWFKPETEDTRPWPEYKSTTLFDTVAVYLAYDEALVDIEKLPIAIDDSGTMSITDGAPQVRAATSWRSLDGFNDHLVERLLA